MMRPQALLLLFLSAACCSCGEELQSDKANARKWEAFKFVSGFFGLDSAREQAAGPSKLSLIGAGFSRTGTKSLEAALLQLGYKIYDTRSMLELKHADRWVLAAELARKRDFSMVEELLSEMEARGYTATLDFPMNLFAPMLAELRPSAKVLMSVRDSEENWVEAWRSVNKVLGNFVARPWCWLVDLNFPSKILWRLYDFVYEETKYPDHIKRHLPWFEETVRWPSLDTEDRRQTWVDLHKRLQRELEETLPAERFSTFNVRSGWAPLLAFLGIQNEALAAEPFPYVNDRKSLQAVRTTMDVIAAGLPLWIFLLLWLTWSCVRRCCCGRSSPKLKES